jgi:hypothetical protein
MDIEFNKSKHKKDIWFVFDNHYYYNSKKIINNKNFPENLYKNKLICYNYSSNLFVSCFVNRKIYGLFLEYNTNLGSALFNSKNGKLVI